MMLNARSILRAAALAAFGGAILSSSPMLAAPWEACGEAVHYPGRTWRPSDAAGSGWDEARLQDAKSRFERMQSASVVIVHRGRLIASWGDPAERFTAQSVRKGLLNSLVGALVDDGRLSLDDSLADLGVEDSDPGLTALERTATLRDLLRSRSGIFHSAIYEVGGWRDARQTLAAKKAEDPARFAPGAYWIYNNWDFNALGTIVERQSRRSIGDMFAREIARPIGMQDFRAQDVQFATRDDEAEKFFGNTSDHRAYVFDISTRDLARYGLLFLACGEWRGRQVLSRDWVLQSLDGVDTRLGRGPEEQATGFGDYGFLWQVDRPGARGHQTVKTREPAYFATGNRGHVLAVFPYLDLVIVHQVGTRGGITADAQKRRAREGSPEATQQEIEDLLNMIIAAHPKAAEAFE